METMTSTRLTPSQQQRFADDGYFFPLSALSEQQVEHYLKCYTDFVDQHQARIAALTPRDRYVVFSELHFALRWMHELSTLPTVLDAVESVIGPDILVWNTNWFTKMPGDKTYVSWHQDGMYWNMSSPKIVTAWIALQPSIPENGCMRVVPGTHKQPAMPHRETESKDNALSRGQDIAVAVDEAHAVDIRLQPGEASLHHVWIVHGSKANTSNIPRIGIAIRYVAAEVKQQSASKPLAMLARGNNKAGNFEVMPSPTDNVLPLGGGKHTEIVHRIRASIMAKK